MVNASEHYKDFHFYDLGSGFGKFPLFAAFMGFSHATGVELDTHRSTQAFRYKDAVQESFPCYVDRLTYVEGNFFDADDWAKTTQKRIIFMANLCWDHFWDELVAKIQTSEFDHNTILVSLGHDKIGTLERIGTIDVETSWWPGTAVHFFRKHA